MTSQFLIRFGRGAALISFLVGMVIFLIYYFTGNSKCLFLGLIYVLTAALTNMALLIRVLIKAFADENFRKKLVYTAGYISLNIPVALLLFWFTGILLNTMRVNIVNSTKQDISGIIVEGCEKRTINILKAGESKTVWIKIPHDCGIFMTYKQGASLKRESVSGYLSNGMGGKSTHHIGTHNIDDKNGS